MQRFIKAQLKDFETALSEVKSGRKKTHWMWYIFPQLAGLGFSETTRFYALKDLREAETFLNHPVLGTRLLTICNALLKLNVNDAHQIFGSPDDVKLKSCMTLFSMVPDTDPVFQRLLDKFFEGKKDEWTMEILNS